jgi:hypothetical protein
MSAKHDVQALRKKLARLVHGHKPPPLWDQTVRAAREHGRLRGTVMSVTEGESKDGTPYALLRVVDAHGDTARVLLHARALAQCQSLTTLLKRLFRVRWHAREKLFSCGEVPPSRQW